jgi:hypothetical protein
MGSAFTKAEEKNEEDELDVLFKDFDKKLKDVEQKFQDITKDLEDFRKEKNVDEE